MWEIVTTVNKNERAVIVLSEALDHNIKTEKAVYDKRAGELKSIVKNA